MKKQYIGILLSVSLISQPAMAAHLSVISWKGAERTNAVWNSKIFLPSEKGRSGLTPLSKAVLENNNSKVNDLIGKKSKSTAAEKKALANSIKMANGKPDPYQVTPLHYAAAKGDTAIIEMLLEAGANVDARDSAGRTPLMWAVAKGREAACEAILKKTLPGDLNVRDLLGRNALHWAVSKARFKIAQSLIAKGGNDTIRAQDNAGNTPLHYAMSIHYSFSPDRQTDPGASMNGAFAKALAIAGGGAPITDQASKTLAKARKLGIAAPVEAITAFNSGGSTVTLVNANATGTGVILTSVSGTTDSASSISRENGSWVDGRKVDPIKVMGAAQATGEAKAELTAEENRLKALSAFSARVAKMSIPEMLYAQQMINKELEKPSTTQDPKVATNLDVMDSTILETNMVTGPTGGVVVEETALTLQEMDPVFAEEMRQIMSGVKAAFSTSQSASAGAADLGAYTSSTEVVTGTFSEDMALIAMEETVRVPLQDAQVVFSAFTEDFEAIQSVLAEISSTTEGIPTTVAAAESRIGTYAARLAEFTLEEAELNETMVAYTNTLREYIAVLQTAVDAAKAEATGVAEILSEQLSSQATKMAELIVEGSNYYTEVVNSLDLFGVGEANLFAEAGEGLGAAVEGEEAGVGLLEIGGRNILAGSELGGEASTTIVGGVVEGGEAGETAITTVVSTVGDETAGFASGLVQKALSLYMNDTGVSLTTQLYSLISAYAGPEVTAAAQAAAAQVTAAIATINAKFAVDVSITILGRQLAAFTIPGMQVVMLFALAVQLAIQFGVEAQEHQEKVDKRHEIHNQRNNIINELLKKDNKTYVPAQKSEYISSVPAYLTRNKEGRLPSHFAAIAGNPEPQKILNDYDKDSKVLEAVDNAGFTPLMYALMRGRVDNLNNAGLSDKLLSRGFAKTTDGAQGSTVEGRAFANPMNLSPLKTALMFDTGKVFDAVFKVVKGDDVYTDVEGKNILHYAALGGKRLKAIYQEYNGKSWQMITATGSYTTMNGETNPMLTAQDLYGATPIHYAAATSAQALKYLLEKLQQQLSGKKNNKQDLGDVLIAMKDKNGMTPLHYAALSGKETGVQTILHHVNDKKKRQALINVKSAAQDTYGNPISKNLVNKTARDLAVMAGYPGTMAVLAHKGELDEKTRKKLRDQAQKAKKERRSESKYDRKRSPAAGKRMETWEGRDIKKHKETDPMIKAAKEARPNVVEVLTREGHDVLIKEAGTGRTALMYAAANGRKEMVDMILVAADKQGKIVELIALKDKAGKTAADLARDNKHKGLADTIEAKSKQQAPMVAQNKGKKGKK